jgi:hypothetical protein
MQRRGASSNRHAFTQTSCILHLKRRLYLATISSATSASPARCSTRCAAWDGCGRPPEPSRPSRDFYRWGSIVRGAFGKPDWKSRLRHLAYAGGWKKLEPMWDWIIRTRRTNRMLPVLEQVLTFGLYPQKSPEAAELSPGRRPSPEREPSRLLRFRARELPAAARDEADAFMQ